MLMDINKSQTNPGGARFLPYTLRQPCYHAPFEKSSDDTCIMPPIKKGPSRIDNKQWIIAVTAVAGYSLRHISTQV